MAAAVDFGFQHWFTGGGSRAEQHQNRCDGSSGDGFGTSRAEADSVEAPLAVETVKAAAAASSTSDGGGRVSWVVVGSLNLLLAQLTYKLSNSK